MANISSIAVSALVASGIQQGVIANNVANLGTSNFRASKAVLQTSKAGVRATVAQGTESVDVSREAVGMVNNRRYFSANVKVVKTTDDMIKALLDVMA
ncbi:flagellar basal body rod C-terminal domain-containing protein [Geomesophilobacter sediminis]|uniref:Flagellar basal body rod protein n=1 Tax=Geomesophilobacter sediminis TaxID=2798584 RepID=A0A8J7LUT9_9BACT|nr:flagellar basal body rod C-terminal domain-containing protein [Geomesophilobacter sediminis]MBJ6725039.1 hypothetical protein [Geomesophilobacter sediminis]